MTKKPLYREIADTLRQQIASGRLKPGDALPTEAQLVEEFGVSRVTVRQALKLLTEQQVIESVQGSGRYVREARLNYDIYQLTSLDEKLAERQASYSEVLDFAIVLPDERVRTALRLTEGERVYYVRRLRFVRQKPAALEETWMPLALFPDLSYEVMQSSKYHYIEQVKKWVIDRSEQEILAVMPTEAQALALGIDRHQPALEKVSIGFLQDGTVFEYSRNLFKSSDYRFTLVAHRRRS